MSTLFVLCGLPGAGKTTYCKMMVKNHKKLIHISRDEIRFDLLKEGEDYFSHEREVTKLFWEKINNALEKGYSVLADQTSLTVKSRLWLMNHIDIVDTKFVCVTINENNLKLALERNKQRYGTKTYVPEKVILRMHDNYESPAAEEGFEAIYHIII